MTKKGYSSILENIPFGETISNIIMFFRPAEWIDKVQFNIAAIFLLLMEIYYNNTMFLDDFFKKFLLFLIFLLLLSCFGYSINAYADRVFDHRVGKYRGVPYFSKNQIYLIFVLISIGILVIPFLLKDARLEIVGILAYIFAAGYSIKPLRFKDRGIYGIIGATIPQRPLVILFFGILINADTEFLMILVVWSLFIGIIMEIGHQMLDYQNDKTSGTNNWIVNANLDDVKKYSMFFMSVFILITFAPLLFFKIAIALTFSFVMLIFSGHSFFYFLDGWKAYNKYLLSSA